MLALGAVVGLLVGAAWAHVVLTLVWVRRRAGEGGRQATDPDPRDAAAAPMSPGRRE